MLGHSPSINLPQSSEYAKEMCKWEAYPSKHGPGLRPYQFHEYPKRMCRAEHVVGKGITVVESHTVNDANEEANLRSRGFGAGHSESFALARAQQTEHGKLAAETDFEIAHGRISEKAAAEVRAAREDYGARHLPEVPVQPVRRRGRPAKAAQ